MHDAFMRWVEKTYIQNIHFVTKLINTAYNDVTPAKLPAFQILLEKVASPLIYLEMDWHNLPDKEKVLYARGAYAEQLARRIQEATRVVNQAQRETNW